MSGVRLRRYVAPVAAMATGATFILWILSPYVMVPTLTTWLMQGDWRVHFLGWQFFRREPWHWPPGRMDGYYEPLGTAIGLTDSIPLAALLFKPFASWLPESFQYFGLWFTACFALQGLFGALLMRLWTPRPLLQWLGAACFVLVPTLLMRVIHPALCAHWLLLWALWLYFRVDRRRRSSRLHATAIEAAALALIAGLVHPYLAAMVLALVGAVGMRLFAAHRAAAVGMVGVAVCATLAGWWLSGFFTITGVENLSAGGLSASSMNLLAPITPTGWSTLLPAIPLGAERQAWEGFHYAGAGLLLLLSMAAVLVLVQDGPPPVVWSVRPALRRPRRIVAAIRWPLFAVAGVLAVYALSPRVTFGDAVLVDVSAPWQERLAIFRAAGRFFWPAGYLLLIAALASIVSRLTVRTAATLLSLALVLQVVDLGETYAARARTARNEFTAWQPWLSSPAWPRVLAHYDHIVTYPPSYCGPPPTELESLAWLAAANGVGLNGGLVARFDEAARASACRALEETLVTRGAVDDTRLYVGKPDVIVLLKQLARQPVVCGVIDGLGICATARSYAAWRDVVHLE